MEIALIVDDYLPSTKSVAKIMSDLAGELVRQGHVVRVLTVSETVRGDCEVEQCGKNLSVVRVRSGPIKGARHVVRAINEMRLSSVIRRRAAAHLGRKADLIVYYSPSIFFGPLVSHLKAKWGVKSYLILRDIFPEWAIEAGVLAEGPLAQFFRWWAHRSYAAADMVGLESTGSRHFFNSITGSRYPTEVLFNWCDGDAGNVAAPSYRERLGLKDKVVFFFGGNLGVAQDIGNLLALAGELRDDPSAHFLFVGEGSECGRIDQYVKQGAGNVTLLPSVSQNEYLSMLREFDVGLISLDRRLKTANVPGKLLGYMACSIPVLASVNPESALPELVGDTAVGFCSLNGDRAALVRDARKLVCDAALRRDMGARSRALLEERFLVSAGARQILALAGGEHPGRDG